MLSFQCLESLQYFFDIPMVREQQRDDESLRADTGGGLIKTLRNVLSCCVSNDTTFGGSNDKTAYTSKLHLYDAKMADVIARDNKP